MRVATAITMGALVFAAAPVPAVAQDAASGPCRTNWSAPAGPAPTGTSPFVVHQNKDYRIDIEKCGDARVQENARGTVAILVNGINYTELDDGARLRLHTFRRLRDDRQEVQIAPGVKANKRLCPSELFQEQGRGPNCSGVVVAPSLVLTAGHCANGREPEDLRIMLDFRTAAGVAPEDEVATGDARLRRVIQVIQVGSKLGSKLKPSATTSRCSR